MYAVCLRYAPDELTAKDILQVGFIKVFKKCQQFENNGSIEGWIRKIMVNTAIEEHRKRKNFLLEPVDDVHNELPATTASTDDIHYKDLLAIVQTLPAGYRTVFNMYAIDGYSHREIAEQMGITESSSKSQLSRARQWLKDRLLKMEDQAS